MQRNLSLIHRILEYTERNGAIKADPPAPTFEGFSAIQVSHHIELCREARYLTVGSGPPPAYRLTWRGHDALDRFRANDL